MILVDLVTVIQFYHLTEIFCSLCQVKETFFFFAFEPSVVVFGFNFIRLELFRPSVRLKFTEPEKTFTMAFHSISHRFHCRLFLLTNCTICLSFHILWRSELSHDSWRPSPETWAGELIESISPQFWAAALSRERTGIRSGSFSAPPECRRCKSLSEKQLVNCEPHQIPGALRRARLRLFGPSTEWENCLIVE